MKAPAKLGIGLGTTMLIPAGIYVKTYVETSGTQSLKDAFQYSSENDKTKFGYEYAYYFLSTKDNLNSNIWKERAKKLRENGSLTNEVFSNIKGTADEISIKKACESKYSENTPNNGADKEKWKEVWTYCSIGGSRPLTISEAKDTNENKYTNGEKKKREASGSGQDKLGKTLKDSVISTYHNSNEWFWKLRDKAFKSGDLVHENHTNHFQTRTTEEIKTICRRAYEITPTTPESQNIPKQEEVKKYCSIEKST